MMAKNSEENELLELLEDKGKTRITIEKELGELADEFQIILVEKSFDKKTIRNQLTKYLIEKGFSGIYVTLNNPVDTLIKSFSKEKVDLKKLFFVDGATMPTGESFQKQKNTVYVNSLKNLIELKIAIQETVEKIGNSKKFIIIDSITTLLIYNKENTVEKFIYSIIEKDRLKNVQTVLLSTPATDRNAMENISQFCDKIIVI